MKSTAVVRGPMAASSSSGEVWSAAPDLDQTGAGEAHRQVVRDALGSVDEDLVGAALEAGQAGET